MGRFIQQLNVSSPRLRWLIDWVSILILKVITRDTHPFWWPQIRKSCKRSSLSSLPTSWPVKWGTVLINEIWNEDFFQFFCTFTEPALPSIRWWPSAEFVAVDQRTLETNEKHHQSHFLHCQAQRGLPCFRCLKSLLYLSLSRWLHLLYSSCCHWCRCAPTDWSMRLAETWAKRSTWRS